jgi:hypothetical protein
MREFPSVGRVMSRPTSNFSHYEADISFPSAGRRSRLSVLVCPSAGHAEQCAWRWGWRPVGGREREAKMEKTRASLVRLCGEVEETLPPPEPASISRLQHTGSSSGCARRAPWCNGGGGCITLFNSIALISGNALLSRLCLFGNFFSTELISSAAFTSFTRSRAAPPLFSPQGAASCNVEFFVETAD